MGWTYGYDWRTPKMVQDHLMEQLKEVASRGQFEILDKASTRYGRNFFVATKGRDGEFSIACFKINGNPKGGYGYKDMDEDMGPVDMEDCPLRLLALAPLADEEKYAPFIERYYSLKDYKAQCAVREEARAAGLPRLYAAMWRQSVREHHERARAQFVPGDKVTIYGKLYEVVRKDRRRYFVRKEEDGHTYVIGSALKMRKAS